MARDREPAGLHRSGRESRTGSVPVSKIAGLYSIHMDRRCSVTAFMQRGDEALPRPRLPKAEILRGTKVGSPLGHVRANVIPARSRRLQFPARPSQAISALQSAWISSSISRGSQTVRAIS
jgi:hypothetical protein